MTETKGYPTKEEAIEAWNTWRGRYEAVAPELFCECNPCNVGALLVDSDGMYVPLRPEKVVGKGDLLPNGAFTVPWPRLTPSQVKAARILTGHNDPIAHVASLCARWCALFPSVVEYRKTIVELLKHNDRDNHLINNQLKKWNEYLSSHGFTIFEKNDLRGINLSGLRLNGKDYSGINLRNIDLSFSECSIAQLHGANLYKANFFGISSIHLNASFAIAHEANFSHGFLSNAHFEGSDLGNANFTNSMCHHMYFNGACLNGADISYSQCTDILLKPLIRNYNGIKQNKSTEISKLVFNDTVFQGTSTDGIDWTKNPKLKVEIDKQNAIYSQDQNKPLWNRIMESTDLKPGWLGISIDLKTLFKKSKKKSVDGL